ncbi:MAG: glycosyltransferase family 4 protein [Acidobacteria bacterium]|nr:glycosyltransferase family 4 protein [Acidobacteriota bacterium]
MPLLPSPGSAPPRNCSPFSTKSPNFMPRPLNFCMITTFYPPYSFGGDAIYLHRLCQELARAGHQVDVIHCADSYRLFRADPGAPNLPQRDGITVHKLESGYGALSPLLSHQTGYPLLKADRIRRVFESRRFDVIHYHNISLFGPAVLELEPGYSGWVKCYTMHEHWLICPVNVLWKYNRRACEKPDCFTCTLISRRPPQLWRYTGLRDRAARSVDQFFSPSRFTRDMHHKRGFPYPIEPLPYFLDRVDQDWKSPGPPPQPRPYFLFVGRLEKIKGLQDVIPEFAGEGDYDLLVSGSGTYEGELRRQAQGTPRVKFLGWAPQDRIGPYYHHALGVIVSSITYDTFCIIIIEAFARKTPVIVHDLGALPEVVYDSGGGYVYRTREELWRAMKLLAEQPVLRRELGERGYDAFCRLWSTEPHLQLYFRFIHEAARRKYGRVEWEADPIPCPSS